MADVPTDQSLDVSWKRSHKVRPGETLHLVVAWLDDSERVGQVGSLAEAQFFGRGERKAGEPPKLDLGIQRPGKLQLAPPLGGTAISRNQLRFTQLSDGTVGVERTGLRVLFHNGQQVQQCVVQAGDTLMLEDAAVFLVESRPERMPGLRAYKGPFAFGQPDPFGIVGETPIVWRMRDLIASVAQQQRRSRGILPTFGTPSRRSGRRLRAPQQVHRLRTRSQRARQPEGAQAPVGIWRLSGMPMRRSRLGRTSRSRRGRRGCHGGARHVRLRSDCRARGCRIRDTRQRAAPRNSCIARMGVGYAST